MNTATNTFEFESLVRNVCRAAGTFVTVPGRVFTDGHGRSYTTTLTDDEIKETLQAVSKSYYTHTTMKTDEFAESLTNQWARKGKLSDKQMTQAVRIALEAIDEVKYTTDELALNDEAANGGDCNAGGVQELFAKTDGRLKQPKVTFDCSKIPEVEMDGNLQFKKVTRGRNKGKIAMTDGGPFNRNKFYGYINEDGSLDLYRSGRTNKDALQEVIDMLGDDAGRMAGQYGKHSGRCCFCAKTLTVDKSVAAGFGMTCAKNYGLLTEYRNAK